MLNLTSYKKLSVFCLVVTSCYEDVTKMLLSRYISLLSRYVTLLTRQVLLLSRYVLLLTRYFWLHPVISRTPGNVWLRLHYC